jgi:hypothetical protein
MTAVVRAWLAFELGLARAVVLWARGRQDGVRTGDVPLTYASAGTPTGPILVALAAVEIVVVELVVPWPVLRQVLLVLGVWTLVLLLGLVAAERTRPHVVRPDGLLVRSGALVRIWLPWHLVGGVERRMRHELGSWGVEDGRLHLPVAGTTAVDVALTEAVDVRLPWRRTARVTALAIAVDDIVPAMRVLDTALAAARCAQDET